MKNILLLLSLLFTSHVIAVCSSPISRTNFAANSVLSSTTLNNQLNAVYTQANELPGDCITNSTVTSAKITDGTIVNADVNANAAIDRSKVTVSNYAVSASDSGAFSTTSTTFVDVTNLTATITTIGRPVEITIIGKETANVASPTYIGVGSSLALATGIISIVRASTDIAFFQIGSLATGSTATTINYPPGSIKHIDIPVAGTYTYKIQVKSDNASYTSTIGNARLMVREL